jgi:putative lipoprotein
MKYLVYILVLVLPYCIASAQTSEQSVFSQPDKQMHFGAGALVGAVSLVTKSKTKAFVYSVVAGSSFGLLKEVYDSRKGGSGFNNADLGATVLGSLSVGLTFNVLSGNKRNRNNYIASKW